MKDHCTKLIIKKGFSRPLISFLIIGLCLPIHSDKEDPSKFSLDRIFIQKEFVPKSFGPAIWVDDDSGYTVLERSESLDGGRDIVRYDLQTGLRKIVIPAWPLIPSGKSKSMKIEDYSWSSDRMKLLMFTNTNRGGRKGIPASTKRDSVGVPMGSTSLIFSLTQKT